VSLYHNVINWICDYEFIKEQVYEITPIAIILGQLLFNNGHYIMISGISHPLQINLSISIAMVPLGVLARSA
jgi:hypothetical protein